MKILSHKKCVSPANKYDSKPFEPTIGIMRKSKNTRIISADSAFDVKGLRSKCKRKNIALIASENLRRKKDKHKINAPYRWIIEQTFEYRLGFVELKFVGLKLVSKP